MKYSVVQQVHILFGSQHGCPNTWRWHASTGKLCGPAVEGMKSKLSIMRASGTTSSLRSFLCALHIVYLTLTLCATCFDSCSVSCAPEDEVIVIVAIPAVAVRCSITMCTRKVCKDGVNRWTDNTWSIKSWMVKTKGMSGADTDRYLQIKGDFDQV